MIMTNWTTQETDLLTSLLAKGMSNAEISKAICTQFRNKAIGFPSMRTENSVRRKVLRNQLQSTTQTTATVATLPEASKTVADAFLAIEKLQKEYLANSITTNIGVSTKPIRKILSLSDIHFPLARNDLLFQVIEEHKDADILVLNGDIIEGYIWSTFKKEQDIAAIHEYNAALEFVNHCRKIFPKVIIVEGNHDLRPAKYLSNLGVPKSAMSILHPQLMQRLANGERVDNEGLLIEKLDFSNVFFDTKESWYVKVGKTLFIHPHGNGSSQPGGTVLNVGAKLLQRYPPGEVDSIVCGHTHQIYKGIVNGVLFIEQGCMASLLTYLFKADNAAKKNYLNGYAVIYQDADGNTNFNLSTPIYLGQCFPPKKETL